MSEGSPRYSLRLFLLAITACSVLIGGYVWLSRAIREADERAVRSAYQDGRLSREQAIDNGLSPDDPAFPISD